MRQILRIISIKNKINWELFKKIKTNKRKIEAQDNCYKHLL